MTPSEAPKVLQALGCNELLDPMRASCWRHINTQSAQKTGSPLCKTSSGLTDAFSLRPAAIGVPVRNPTILLLIAFHPIGFYHRGQQRIAGLLHRDLLAVAIRLDSYSESDDLGPPPFFFFP